MRVLFRHSSFSLAQAFYAWGWKAIKCVSRFPFFAPFGGKKGKTGDQGVPFPQSSQA